MPRAEVLEAGSLTQALLQIQDGVFDLVLLDVNLSNVGTVDALTAAREASPASYFAIISASDTRAEVLAALAAGLHGFIFRHQSDPDILDAITNLLFGRIYVPCSVGAADDSSVSQGDKEGASFLSTEVDLSKLTKRQREVLPFLLQGLSNKEIARALEIAERDDENSRSCALAHARRAQSYLGSLQSRLCRQFDRVDRCRESRR